MKNKKSLTQRAIDIVNNEFKELNPYSLSGLDWTIYNNKVDKLIYRLKKQ